VRAAGKMGGASGSRRGGDALDGDEEKSEGQMSGQRSGERVRLLLPLLARARTEMQRLGGEGKRGRFEWLSDDAVHRAVAAVAGPEPEGAPPPSRRRLVHYARAPERLGRRGREGALDRRDRAPGSKGPKGRQAVLGEAATGIVT
jgi:hypothetical protein